MSCSLYTASPPAYVGRKSCKVEGDLTLFDEAKLRREEWAELERQWEWEESEEERFWAVTDTPYDLNCM